MKVFAPELKTKSKTQKHFTKRPSLFAGVLIVICEVGLISAFEHVPLIYNNSSKDAINSHLVHTSKNMLHFPFGHIT